MTDAAYTDTIIDGHCHLASTKFIPREFYLGLAQNINAKFSALGVERPINHLVDTYLKGSQDHFGERLISEMDSANIQQSVLLLPDFTYVMKADLTIAEMFEHHYTVKQKYDGRFYVFAGADPRWGQDGIDLFEKGITEYGFDGLKLYPPCGYSASDALLYPYYEICDKYNLPVLLHTGPTAPTLAFEYSDPNLIGQAALDFPQVNFILAHGAVTNVEATALLCAYRPNIYTDISAFIGSLHPKGWSYALKQLFRRNLNHKIIFGTDWPVFQNSGGQNKVLSEFCGSDGPLAGLAATQKQWLMNKNIQRLIKGTACKTQAAKTGINKGTIK